MSVIEELRRLATCDEQSFTHGGPWGYRHQINIADSGFGSRGPRVFNDRAGEVGRTLNVKDFDLERIFGKENVHEEVMENYSEEYNAKLRELSEINAKLATRFWGRRKNKERAQQLEAEIASINKNISRDFLKASKEAGRYDLEIENSKNSLAEGASSQTKRNNSSSQSSTKVATCSSPSQEKV